MLNLTKHAVTGKSRDRIIAYGLTPQEAVRLVAEKGSSVSMSEFGIHLASSRTKVCAGKSTGRALVAIVRGGQWVTTLNADRATPRCCKVKEVI